MVLYLYSAFLALMTTQRSLQYSFTFTHSHSASIGSTLLFYGGQFGVQHLAQGHFGLQIWKTGDRNADLQVGGRPLYPLSHSRPYCVPDCVPGCYTTSSNNFYLKKVRMAWEQVQAAAAAQSVSLLYSVDVVGWWDSFSPPYCFPVSEDCLKSWSNLLPQGSKSPPDLKDKAV